MMTVLHLFFMVLTVVFPLAHAMTSRIKIENGAYQGIIVAFDPDTKEKEGRPLIDQIKKLFISTSAVLFEATRRRSYFGQVTILVPKSWQWRHEYEIATFENFGEADVKIADPNPHYGDGPYTLQPYPCGFAGLYIHLTPNYLKYLEENSTIIFGDPAKTLVHEWAHLRYGVFDEFGQRDQPLFPLFYYDSHVQEVLPNICANQELQGQKWDFINDYECKYENGLPDENCIFIPNLNENEATSSLSSFHFLPKVHMFCDETEQYLHNRMAPNKQNYLCNGASTWKIISTHADFAGTNNGPLTEKPNLTPQITIVKQMEETFSLVLDVSTSMNEPEAYTKLQMMQNVIAQWLRYEVKTGSAVGIVTFSTKTVYKGIMQMIDSNSSETLVGELPLEAYGWTCIGCGLESGLQQLREYRNTSGGTIILLSDGEENRDPFIESVQQSIVDAHVRVITIAFTDEASNKIEQLAQATGGKAYFVRLEEGESGLGSAFFDAITYQTADFDLPVKVSDEIHNGSENVYEGSYSIDFTIGNTTTVNFLYTVDDDIETIRITGPNLHITSDDTSTPDQTITKETAIKLIRFQFSFLEPGTYNYTVNRKSASSNQQKVTVSVTSKASGNGTKPITTNCRTEFQIVDDRPLLAIYAEVKQGNNPVINAAVMAKIDRPNAESVLLQLLDKGSGNPDVTKDDGIYTRYFTGFTGKGRYSVKAQIVGDGQTSIQDQGFIASQSMPIVNDYTAKLSVTSKPSGVFQRTASGGTINLEEDIHESVDNHFPPNRVVDLRASLVSSLNYTITLQWTAPGGNLDTGYASYYEIRYSLSWDELFDHFNGTQILMALIPNEGGAEEKHDIQIPGVHALETCYFALKAFDAQNQSSKTSNIAQVPFSRNDPVTTRQTSPTSNPTEETFSMIDTETTVQTFPKSEATQVPFSTESPKTTVQINLTTESESDLSTKTRDRNTNVETMSPVVGIIMGSILGVVGTGILVALVLICKKRCSSITLV